MSTNDLVLPHNATALVLADVTRFGAASVETGGFFLAPRGGDEITIVAHTRTAGIVRRRRLFQISDLALDRLFGYADEHDLWIPAQFHSHARAAFLSATDVDHGLCVEGFLSTIIPYFAAPPTDPSKWGWWRYQNTWTSIAPPRPSAAPIDAFTFDEDGVHGA
jgi:hypothetical protein